MRAWRVPRTCGAGCARAAPYDLHAEISRLLFVFWRRSYDRGKTLAAAEKARSRGRVRKAVRCYLKVLELEPGHVDATIDLADQLRRDGTHDEAKRLLAGLLVRIGKVRSLRRRVRFAQFRLEPSIRGVLDWALAR